MNFVAHASVWVKSLYEFVRVISVRLKRRCLSKIILYVLMDSPFWLDTINLVWFIVNTVGYQVTISNLICISVSENCLHLSKTCRH